MKFKDILKCRGLLGLLMVLTGGVCLSASAEQVSQKQASKIAEAFFNAAYGEYTPTPKLVWNGRQLTTNRLFAPFYIYNHSRGGFVIISADNKAFPVLGYSLTNNFSRDNLGESETELLRQYAHEIEMIRYDSRSPDRAIRMWTHLPSTLDSVLRVPYSTPEFDALADEARENIENIDRRNGWVMMPSAIEFKLYRPELYRDYILEDALGDEEEVPFSFYENFRHEIEEEERQRLAALEEIITPTKPVVNYLGGAHYELSFPEDIKLCRVYDASGRRMLEKYFESGNIANLDLSALPAGFYITMLLGKEGHIYGLKLAR